MKTEELEARGYEYIGNLLKRISNRIGKIAGRFSKWSERFYFERFRIYFGERDDDIYIVTYPKSGTTLMQMILYQLTTDGNLDFNHIYDVSPWIRNDSYRKLKPRKLKPPRLIKTHDKYFNFDRSTKGRFIFVYRDGRDVAVSHYHQNKNYNNPNLKFENYMKGFYKSRAWFKFCKAWFRNKYQFPILYLRYEDLLENKDNEVRKIIDFLNIDPTDEQISRAIEMSSFEFMKQLEDKFGDKEPEVKRVYDQFIRKGEKGEGERELSEADRKKFDVFYDKILKKAEEKAFSKSHS